MNASRRAAGFTLLEVLVALSIVTLLGVMGYRGVTTLTAAEAQLKEESARWRDLDRFFDRLEGDLRQALPRSAQVGGRAEPALTVERNSSGVVEVRFSRGGDLSQGPDGPMIRPPQRTGYRFRDGGIDLRLWPATDEFTASSGEGPPAYRLLDGVVSWEWEFYDTKAVATRDWVVTDPAALPGAVSVRLQLASGTTVQRLLHLRR